MKKKPIIWAVAVGAIAGIGAVVLLVVLSPFGETRSEAKMPPHVKAALFGAERMELFSILPEGKGPPEEGSFRGYVVLGKTEITDAATRKRLATALEDGTRDANSVAACFIPHHGLRLVQGGKTMDLVICFTCRQVVVLATENDRNYETFLVTISPLKTFNELLSTAGVPLPPMETHGEE